MANNTIKYLVVSLVLMCSTVRAQNDTIHLKNNNVIVGELKYIQTGILEIETSYSDKDFKIEFNKVTKLIIQKQCFITLTDTRRRFGNIRSDSIGRVTITLPDNSIEHYRLNEVVNIEEIESNFWKRFAGNIDFSYNFTRANNDAQFTIGGGLVYTSEKWKFSGTINMLESTRDNTEDIIRNDASIDVRRILAKKLYILGSVSYLKNTEQALNYRVNPSLSFGRLMISTNKLYLGVNAGLAYNNEDYEDVEQNRSSSEILIAANFDMFDVKDFNFQTGVNIYPSLSESGRIRVDYDLALKYDLPWDLYIKMQFSLNYDNQPAVEGTEVDYVFTSGFGWEFNK